MKNVLSSFAIVATLSLTAVLPNSVAESNPAPSKSELKTLVRQANTPAQHQAVAAYYRHQVEALRANSREHLASAERRAKNLSFAALEAKHGFAFGLGASHCRYWASVDANEASKAEAIAALHEDMARKAEVGTSKQEVAINVVK